MTFTILKTKTRPINLKSKAMFYYYKKVFIHSNIWMIGKSSMKKYFPQKKFYSNLNMEGISGECFQ